MKLTSFLLTTFILLFFTPLDSSARSDASTNNVSQIIDTGKVLVEYSQFIRDETAIHQAFLEGIYDKLVKVFAGIVIAFGAVFTWLNWKTKKDISAQVNERIDSMAKVAIDKKLNAFDEQLHSVRENLNNQVKALRELMDEQLKDINQVMFAEEPRFQTIVKPSPKTLARKKEILWVDDYPENNNIPAEILRSHDVDITTTLSTEDALKKLSHHSFDLIISDMGRGTNSSAGLDLLKELRDRHSEIPVIVFCSSKAASRFGAEARNLGAVGVTSGTTSLLDSAFRALNLS